MNFFIVSAGEPGSDYIENNFKDILETNEFALYANTAQKGTYYSIEKDDVLILKYERNFVAYGTVVRKYSNESKNFSLRVQVKEWILHNVDDPKKGVSRYGIQNATIGGGKYGTVKTVKPSFGLDKIREINETHNEYYIIFSTHMDDKDRFRKKGDYFDLHEELFTYLLKKSESDPDFTFVTRDSNNNNALEKGYWFYGEDTVAISFWTEMDFIEDIPVISFLINPDEHCRLIIQTDIQEDLKKYFEDSRWWKDELKGLNQRDTWFVKEYNNFDPADYINCLSYFLRNDFHIINKIIYEDNLVPGLKRETIKESPDDFDGFVLQLPNQEFNLRIKNIFKYRQNQSVELSYDSVDDENKADSLREIIVHNYGLIKNQKLEIGDSKWVFITGENGSGKTMFLRAIGTILGNKTLTKKEIQKVSLHVNASFNSGKRIIPFERFANSNLKSKMSNFSRGLAMYGPYRLQHNSGLVEIKDYRQSIGKNGSFRSLFGDGAKLLSLVNQFEFWQDNSKNKKMAQARMEQIFSLLPKIIPDLRKVECIYNQNKFSLEYLMRSEGSEKLMKLKWHELSSGNKSILNLVSDILIRLYYQQPRVIDPSELRGTIMIDEIDLHLHPKAQKELVETLSKTFPLLQFIVTTHSAVPLLGAPENSIICVVKRNAEQGIIINRLLKLEKEIGYLTPNTILTSDIFNFNFFDEISETRYEHLYLEDKYEDIQKNIEVNERLSKLNEDIFPKDLFKD